MTPNDTYKQLFLCDWSQKSFYSSLKQIFPFLKQKNFQTQQVLDFSLHWLDLCSFLLICATQRAKQFAVLQIAYFLPVCCILSGTQQKLSLSPSIFLHCFLIPSFRWLRFSRTGKTVSKMRRECFKRTKWTRRGVGVSEILRRRLLKAWTMRKRFRLSWEGSGNWIKFHFISLKYQQFPFHSK